MKLEKSGYRAMGYDLDFDDIIPGSIIMFDEAVTSFNSAMPILLDLKTRINNEEHTAEKIDEDRTRVEFGDLCNRYWAQRATYERSQSRHTKKKFRSLKKKSIEFITQLDDENITRFLRRHVFALSPRAENDELRILKALATKIVNFEEKTFPAGAREKTHIKIAAAYCTA